MCVLTSISVQLQIEDVSRKLRAGDLGIPANPDDRLKLMRSSHTNTMLAGRHFNSFFSSRSYHYCII